MEECNLVWSRVTNKWAQQVSKFGGNEVDGAKFVRMRFWNICECFHPWLKDQAHHIIPFDETFAVLANFAPFEDRYCCSYASLSLLISRAKLRSQWKQYLAAPVPITPFAEIGPDELVKYWEAAMHQTPELAKVALAVMSVPFSSARVERSFKTSKKSEFDPSRSAMKPEKKAKLSIIVSNAPLELPHDPRDYLQK